MVAITLLEDPTLKAVDTALEVEVNAEPLRPYLGMSGIGNQCLRRIWLDFRWVSRRSMGAYVIRCIQDGYAGEDVMAARLLTVPGIILSTKGDDGKQIEIQDHAGHYRGHLDGQITGILQAPKTTHVWEHKQKQEKDFKELLKHIENLGEKSALAAWNDLYYSQAQVYMGYTGLKRHYLTCSLPGGRNYISVRTNKDPKEFDRLRNKALQVITSTEPFDKISTDPSFFKCKLCDQHAICHRKQFPEINCRTCIHATPELDGNGRWSCALVLNSTIPVEAQRTGCPMHIFIPPLVPNAKPIVADPDSRWIEYRERGTGRVFRNGSGVGSMSSQQMRDFK